MNDYAIKNYHAAKPTFLTKLKVAAVIMLAFATGCGILASVCEYGHAMQMERLAAGD